LLATSKSERPEKTWLFEEEGFVPLSLIQDGKAYNIVCNQLGTPTTEAYDKEEREVWRRKLDMNGNILGVKYDKIAR